MLVQSAFLAYGLFCLGLVILARLAPFATSSASRSAPMSPFLVLAVAVISQTSAGTLYWFPAVTPGIKSILALSSAQATAIVACANSGSVLGIIAGLLHDRYGSRITALVGAIGTSACFFIISLIITTAQTPLPTYMFAILILVVICLVAFSFMLYSANMTAAVSSFTPKYRGRIVGLGATMYGGSSGVLSAIQAAFFPGVAQTPHVLLFTSAMAFTSAVAIYLSYPYDKPYDIHNPSLRGEETPVLRSSDAYNAHVDRRVSNAYAIAFGILVSMQFAALSDVFQAPRFVKMAAAVILCSFLLSLLVLPASTSMRAFPLDANASSTSPSSSPSAAQDEPAFAQVIKDPRYIVLLSAFTLHVGGGGVMLLVQLPQIVSSFRYSPNALWAHYASESIVRALVTLFAAGNMGGRLFMGSIMDNGASALARHMWKYTLLCRTYLLMAFGATFLCVPSRLGILIGVSSMGLAYGAFFATAPALVTLWFGVHSFPRNFAIPGFFIPLASFTLVSTVPAWLRMTFGTWKTVIEDGVESRVCAGLSCRLPMSALTVSLLLFQYAMGVAVRNRVLYKAETSTF